MIFVFAGTTTVASSGPVVNGYVTTSSGNNISSHSGVYYEDYFLNSTCVALGGKHLDGHNGHSHGSYGYHYHTTVNTAMSPTFPFSIGPKYYGCVQGATCYGTHSAKTSNYTSSCGTTLAAAETLTCGGVAVTGMCVRLFVCLFV